ncbi:MAG: PAS domain S-box protein [Chloroflexi bacterium]|nr:PAS domain S-box protein [Chloroflexota bacterium]
MNRASPPPGRANQSVDRRRIQDAALFRLLVDRVVDYAIFLLTPEGRIASWNAGAERLKGYTADEIIGESFERFYRPEDREAGLPQNLLGIARSEGRVEHRGWRVKKDGSHFWADVVITALYDDTGVLRGFAKITRDLSDQRQSEERLRQSEERFRLLVASIKDYAVFMLSPDGIVLTWNQGAMRLKGYAPDEIIGQSFERFYTPEDRLARMPAQLLGIARAEGRVETEGWRVRKDGSRFWADVVITALTDDAGQLAGYAKVTRDMTDRVEAERERATRFAAERTAERLGRLQATTAALAAVIRPEDAARILTESGVSSLGAAGGLVAIPDELADGSDASGIRIAYATDMPNASGDIPSPVMEVFSTRRPLFRDEWGVVPLVVDDHVLAALAVWFGAPRRIDDDQRGLLLALAEVGAQAIDRAAAHQSERRARAEAEEAVRAQDEFLSIASHELRTPVTAVKATAQLLKRAIERERFDPVYGMRHLDSIARAADRLSTLVEDLLDISRLRTGQLKLRPQAVDIGEFVSEIVGRYVATQASHEFQLDVRDGLVVDIDPVRLEQVLDNLLSNAVKYSPEGGHILVSVGPDGDGVRINVTDSGIGLPMGQESRIFEVFGRASNAAAQQIPGLGLGLAICRQLIEAHGGHIWATSPGEQCGSTLSVWLPIATQQRP